MVAVVKVRDRLLEHPVVYGAWQAPFAAQKFAPVERWLQQHDVRRVLDVGCGAGTNAPRFENADYVGIDINERYLESARARFPRAQFVHADLTRADLTALGSFDFVLINSFLHHVDDASVARILQQVSGLLAPSGRIHILELVLPERRSMARLMARLDRGRYRRPLDDWRKLFSATFAPEVVQPYFFGGRLWSMIHFQGRRRT